MAKRKSTSEENRENKRKCFYIPSKDLPECLTCLSIEEEQVFWEFALAQCRKLPNYDRDANGYRKIGNPDYWVYSMSGNLIHQWKRYLLELKANENDPKVVNISSKQSKASGIIPKAQISQQSNDLIQLKGQVFFSLAEIEKALADVKVLIESHSEYSSDLNKTAWINSKRSSSDLSSSEKEFLFLLEKEIRLTTQCLDFKKGYQVASNK